MSGVFLSYRRSDSAAICGRLYEHLADRFGLERIFKDIDSISIGERFSDAIDRALFTCSIVLAVIGPTWVNVTDRSGERRIDDLKDFVRVELETALKRHLTIIPVLVGGASVPERGQLPESLQPLLERQAATISGDPDDPNDESMHYSIATLCDTIAPLFSGNDYLVEAQCLRIPQHVIATCLARHLGADHQNLTFSFCAEDGDLLPQQSHLELANGTEITFAWPDLDAAVELAVEQMVPRLLEGGFVITDRTVDAVPNGGAKFDSTVPIVVCLEKLNGGFDKASSGRLYESLYNYAHSVTAATAGSPNLHSLTDELVHELIKREAWGELTAAIEEVRSVRPPLAESWIRLVQMRQNELKDKTILSMINVSAQKR